MYDKVYGTINKTIANYWKDHFDLAHIIERDWDTLKPKLKGKMRIAVEKLLLHYGLLTQAANASGRRLWNLTPKFHYLYLFGENTFDEYMWSFYTMIVVVYMRI